MRENIAWVRYYLSSCIFCRAILKSNTGFVNIWLFARECMRSVCLFMYSTFFFFPISQRFIGIFRTSFLSVYPYANTCVTVIIRMILIFTYLCVSLIHRHCFVDVCFYYFRLIKSHNFYKFRCDSRTCTGFITFFFFICKFQFVSRFSHIFFYSFCKLQTQEFPYCLFFVLYLLTLLIRCKKKKKNYNLRLFCVRVYFCLFERCLTDDVNVDETFILKIKFIIIIWN